MSQEGKSDGEKGRHEDDKVRQQEWEAERRESHRQPQDAELREEEVTLGFQEAALICSAAVTECHNLGGFNNTHSFSHSSGGCEVRDQGTSLVESWL